MKSFWILLVVFSCVIVAQDGGDEIIVQPEIDIDGSTFLVEVDSISIEEDSAYTDESDDSLKRAEAPADSSVFVQGSLGDSLEVVEDTTNTFEDEEMVIVDDPMAADSLLETEEDSSERIVSSPEIPQVADSVIISPPGSSCGLAPRLSELESRLARIKAKGEVRDERIAEANRRAVDRMRKMGMEIPRDLRPYDRTSQQSFLVEGGSRQALNSIGIEKPEGLPAEVSYSEDEDGFVITSAEEDVFYVIDSIFCYRPSNDKISLDFGDRGISLVKRSVFLKLANDLNLSEEVQQAIDEGRDVIEIPAGLEIYVDGNLISVEIVTTLGVFDYEPTPYPVVSITGIRLANPGEFLGAEEILPVERHYPELSRKYQVDVIKDKVKR